MPHELIKNQKTLCFEVSSSFILWKMNWCSQIVMCDEKWTIYNWQWSAQWLDWEEAPKHFQKLNLHQKMVMVTLWWSAPCLIHYSFLNPNEAITSANYAQQINEMHQKLQVLQPALVNRKGPILLHDNAWLHITPPMLQKLNEWYHEVLHHLPYSPDFSLIDYRFFKHLNNFLWGKGFHNQQDTENAFQEFIKSKAQIFMLQE